MSVIAWQQPMWGAVAQQLAGGGGAPPDVGSSFAIFSVLDSPITSGYEQVPGIISQGDGPNKFIAPFDMTLKAWSDHVTRTGGYRVNTTFAYRINGGSVVDLATITAGTEGFRLNSASVAITAGDEVELLYSCGNNFNMAVGLAFYFEATDPADNTGGAFWVPCYASSITASAAAAKYGDFSSYTARPVAPKTMILRRVTIGLGTGTSTEDCTFYLEDDAGDTHALGTITTGNSSGTYALDIPILAGDQLPTVYASSATGGQPGYTAVLELAFADFPDKPNQSFVSFTDNDSDAAQAWHYGYLVAPSNGVIKELHFNSQFSYGSVTVNVEINGVDTEVFSGAITAGVLNQQLPNLGFSAGDELRFHHNGTGVTSGGLDVFAMIEIPYGDAYESPAYVAPVADQPSGAEHTPDIQVQTESTSFNNSKGSYVLCKEDRWLTNVRVRYGTAGMTAFVVVAECDYNYDIVDIVYQSTPETSIDNWQDHFLDTPVLLEEGKIYMLMAVRTDTDRVVIWYDADPVNMDSYFPFIGQIAAHNDVTPAIGENFYQADKNSRNHYCIALVTERNGQDDKFKLWSILCEGSDDGLVQSIANVVFRETPGGTDLATPSALLASAYDAGNEPGNAVDANLATRWKITDADFDAANRRLIVRFDEPVNIYEIDISAVNDGNHDETPTAFKLQFSEDGLLWNDHLAVTGESAWASGETRTFTKSGYPADAGLSPHRYWAVFHIDSGNATYNHIAELEMRESASGADVTTTGFAIAGTSRTGFEAIYAFDDTISTSNSWGADRSTTTHMERYVGQDFGAGNEKTIVEVAISTRDDSFEEQAPNAFIVAWSDDGVTWVPSWAVADATRWTAGETRVYTKP